MRAFRLDPAPASGWVADWRVEDRFGYLPAGAEVHLRRIDLTPGAEVLTCEGWIAPGAPHASAEAWIPRIVVRRRAAEAPLASTFAGIIEPYGDRPSIAGVRRLPLTTTGGEPCPEAHVAVEVTLADGRRDLLVALDAEHPLDPAPTGILVQKDWDLALDGELCLVRRDASGRPTSAHACRARSLAVAGRRWDCGGSDQWRWTYRPDAMER